jgi:hypothetical protein
MAEDQKDLRLDSMLDSFLSTYVAAEPRPGLELRIRAALRARAQRRRRVWIFMVAGAAAVLVMAAMMTQLRPSRPGAPANVAAVITPPPFTEDLPHTTAPPSSSWKVSRVAAGPRASKQASATNRVLLQAANVMTGDLGDPVFEQERLYIAPVQQSAEMPTSAPSITIQDLGVESLEIKELPSAKNTDSKGDL